MESCNLFDNKFPDAARKAYSTIRSLITFHGIFMAHGYALGVEGGRERRGIRPECEPNPLPLVFHGFDTADKNT